MMPQTKRKTTPLCHIRKTLSTALLLSSLTCTPAYAEPYNGPNNNPLPSSHYHHSAWWIAGIGAASAAAMSSNSIDKDKKKHFGVSVVLGAASEFGLRQLDIANDSRWGRIALATGIGMIPGILKEISDSREKNNKFDKQDLVADALGSLTGAVLSDLIQGPVQNGPQYSITIDTDRAGLAINYTF
ncbi:hypothetical protein [Endozoicomonas acroporae]|uniref:hypothetical protein n=1 Tax=Endozoicomonas acroporae TaxID=1701104 RepID=UPI003D7B1F17